MAPRDALADEVPPSRHSPVDAPTVEIATPEDRYEQVLQWLRDNAGLSQSAESAASRAQLVDRDPLPLVLNRLGAVSDGDLQAAFLAVSGLAAAEGSVDRDIAQVFALSFMKARRCLVFVGDDDTVRLGLVDPFDEEAIRGAHFATGRPVVASVLRAAEQRRLFAEAFEDASTAWAQEIAERDEGRTEAALEFDRDAPVARRVAGWLADAVARRASDVHIEPRSNDLCIRYRIDGVLQKVADEPLAAAASVIARIKVLANLDLGERRAAQDGRTTIVVGGRPIDLRVSIVPSVNGEAAVMRILDRGEVRLDFTALGFSQNERTLLDRALAWPHGLFLVTGPTGQGKTTTLYAGLEAMRGDARKVLTIEDPVEFHFDHVTQVQNAPKAGVTFPSAIRSFLRQDPDVILVGEIRDGETARAAVQAALTGHLVLATLHAIDAPRAVPRLLDMGVEPFQLAACFRGALAQRLVRRLCPHCRRARQPSQSERKSLGLADDAVVYDAVGCGRCLQAGFQGRIVIAEGFEATDAFLNDVRDLGALDRAAETALQARLRDDGAAKVAAGLTTSADVIRALSG
jgi:type II secretory ATPase GspE/PulE/Tfp pilus assembly ATPase PilB-like protein